MVTILTGPMFSGKTTRLQELTRQLKAAGKDVRCFKHANDLRFHEENIVTHDGQHIHAEPVLTAGQVLDGSYGADVVCIDEAQFFPTMLSACILALTAQNTDVIVAGLNSDSTGAPWRTMETISKIPHKLEIFTSVCSVCKKAAMRTQRKPGVIPGTIGSFESYETRCDEHFTGDKDD